MADERRPMKLAGIEVHLDATVPPDEIRMAALVDGELQTVVLTGVAVPDPEPAPQDSPGPEQVHRECGCVTCICEDEKQCHGCGGKNCGRYPHCRTSSPGPELPEWMIGPTGLLEHHGHDGEASLLTANVRALIERAEKAERVVEVARSSIRVHEKNRKDLIALLGIGEDLYPNVHKAVRGMKQHITDLEAKLAEAERERDAARASDEAMEALVNDPAWGKEWVCANARRALEESVKLQSHYARLLNQYDGGERRTFANADEWIARVVEVDGPAEAKLAQRPTITEEEIRAVRSVEDGQWTENRARILRTLADKLQRVRDGSSNELSTRGNLPDPAHNCTEHVRIEVTVEAAEAIDSVRSRSRKTWTLLRAAIPHLKLVRKEADDES